MINELVCYICAGCGLELVSECYPWFECDCGGHYLEKEK